MVLVTCTILSWFPNSALFAWIGFPIALISLFRLWLSKQFHQWFEILYKWRWLIALLLFGVGVLLQLHFSNVVAYAYAEHFSVDSSVPDSILFGVTRIFRTDEYNVQLP